MASALGLGIVANSENNKSLTEEQKNLLNEEEIKARKIIISRFINIIEEPEQNLFPDSQNKVLYDLLECNNTSEDNQLLITTHSPYIISYLTLSTKVKNILDKGISEQKINSIVPKAAAIDGNKLRIYETHDDGSISLYVSYEDETWNTTVISHNRDDVYFNAIDGNIIIKRSWKPSEKQRSCDAMIHTEDYIVFVEIKDWRKHKWIYS